MLNNVTITGRLTSDPKVNIGSTGTEFINFTIACERDYKAEGKERETDFIDVRAFNGTAIFIGKYFEKGSPITVMGRLQRDVWDDKETGKKRSKIVVIVNNAYFAGSSSACECQSGYTPESQSFGMPDSEASLTS